MKQLIKNFLVFGLATMTDRLLSFILLPIYARYFSVSGYGVVDMTQTFIGIISIIGFIQLDTSLQRYYYNYKGEEKKQFAFTIIATTTILSTLLAIIILPFCSYISDLLYNSKEYAEVVFWATLQIPFLIFFTMGLLLLRFEKRNKEFTIAVISRVLLLVLMVYIFIIYLDLGIKGLFIAQLISYIFSCGYIIYQVKSALSYNINTVQLKRSLKYSLPQFPAAVANMTNSYANRFFIVGFLSTYSLGLFSMSLKIASIMLLIQQVFMMAWNQFMFEYFEKENHKQEFVRVYNLILPLLFCFVAAISLFSRELLEYIISAEFIESAKYIGILCFANSLIIIKEIIDIGPKKLEKTGYLTINFFISLAVNLSLLSVLVPRFELDGVVIALLSSNAALLISSWIVSYKLYPINFGITKSLILTIPIGIVIYILHQYTNLGLLYRIVMFTILIIVYGLYCFRNLKTAK